MKTSAPDSTTLAAWFGIVVCGGSNAVAIRMGSVHLEPFWGATLRFGLAAVVLLAIMVWRRPPLPRGRALVSVGAYGLLNFAGSYAFIYWGLVDAPAGAAQIMISTAPILTVLLAAAVGLEVFGWQRFLGTVVAAVGTVVVFGDQLRGGVPLASMAALFASAVCIAASGIVVKKFPVGNPISANAIGMLTGAVILGVISVLAAESWRLPAETRTWASLAYLIVVGSVGLFMLFLYVIERWSATAASYPLLLMPLVTVIVAAVLLDEPIRPLFLAGAALVLLGVYLGAFAPPLRQPKPDSAFAK